MQEVSGGLADAFHALAMVLVLAAVAAGVGGTLHAPENPKP